jgi:sulfatase modifying factor 1
MRVLPWILLAACTDPSVGTIRRPPGETGGDSGTPVDTDVTVPIDTAPTGPCPSNMVLVDGRFCIDAYEATLEEHVGNAWTASSPFLTVDGRTVRAVVAPGMVPQAYISGAEAQDACEASGKRLCASDEWLAACQGPDQTTWPYGNTHQTGACNDTYEGGNGRWGHPVEDLFDSSDVWDMEHMNDPRINQQPNTVTPGGSYPACVSDWGAYDLHGNVHEWVSDADGKFRGGFFADASINGPGCLYVTTAHEFTYHDYSTGFRCCADPR